MKRVTMQTPIQTIISGTDYTTVLNTQGPGEICGLMITQDDASGSSGVKITIDGIEFSFTVSVPTPAGYPQILVSLFELSYFGKADPNTVSPANIQFQQSLKLEVCNFGDLSTAVNVTYGLEI